MADQVRYVDNELGDNSNAGTAPGASAKKNLFSAIASLSGHSGNHTIWVKARSSGAWTGETTYCNFANLADGSTVVVEGYSVSPGDAPTGGARPTITTDPNWDYLRDGSTSSNKLATFKHLYINHESTTGSYKLCVVASTAGLGLAFENCRFRRQTPSDSLMFQLLRTTSPKSFTFTDCYFDGASTTLGGFQLDVRASSSLQFVRCHFDVSPSFSTVILALAAGAGPHSLVEFTSCTGTFPSLISSAVAIPITKAVFTDNNWTVTTGPVFNWTRGTADTDTIRFLLFRRNTIVLTGDLTSNNVIGVGVTVEDSTPTYKPVMHILDNRIYHTGETPQATSGAHILYVGHNCGAVRIERNVIVDYRTSSSAYAVVCKGLGGGSIRNNVFCASYGLYLVGCHAFTVENNVLLTSAGTGGEKACVAFGITAGGSYAPYGCVIRRNILCGLNRTGTVGFKSQVSSISPGVIHAASDENIFYGLQYLSNFQTAGPTDNFTTTLPGLQTSWAAQTTLCASFGNDENSRIADPGIRNWTGTRLEDFGVNSWASPAAPPIASRTDNGYGCLRPRWKRHGVPKSVVLGG